VEKIENRADIQLSIGGMAGEAEHLAGAPGVDAVG